MIDLQWLLTGKGDMLKTKSSQSQKTGGNNPNSTGKDNNNSSLNQTFTTDIVDKFLAIIKNKDEKQSEVAHSAPENSPEGIPPPHTPQRHGRRVHQRNIRDGI